jgi:hypothetical protein
VGGRRMGTGRPMLARIRIGRMPSGGGGCGGVGAEPSDGAACALDLRAAVGGLQRRGHRAGAHGAGCALPVRGGPGPQRAPSRWRVGAADGRGPSSPTRATPAGRCGTGSAPSGLANGASRRSRPVEWTISTTTAHPALISESEFVAAQQVKAVRATKNGCSRRYLLSGIVQCALCGRRLNSHWYTAAPDTAVGMATPAPGRDRWSSRRASTCARMSCSPNRARAPRSRWMTGRHTNAASMVAQLRAAGLKIVHDGTCWEIAGH